MKRNAIEKRLLLTIAGWVMPFVALASAGCSAAPNPRNLDEFFSQGWMLKSSVIESSIKEMLAQRCGDNPTQQCMKAVGFQECLETLESVECSYSKSILVKHDPRAKVEKRKEILNIELRLRLNAGMSIRGAEILIGRSGTNFIFR